VKKSVRLVRKKEEKVEKEMFIILVLLIKTVGIAV
jgi:hypothetical protein